MTKIEQQLCSANVVLCFLYNIDGNISKHTVYTNSSHKIKLGKLPLSQLGRADSSHPGCTIVNKRVWKLIRITI